MFMGRALSWLRASKVIWLTERKKKTRLMWKGAPCHGGAGDCPEEGWKQLVRLQAPKYLGYCGLLIWFLQRNVNKKPDFYNHQINSSRRKLISLPRMCITKKKKHHITLLPVILLYLHSFLYMHVSNKDFRKWRYCWDECNRMKGKIIAHPCILVFKITIKVQN